MNQNNSLLAKLIKAGIVQNQTSDLDTPQSKTLQSPWYIKTLLAVSGWLGALFFLIFIALFLFLSENVDEPAFIGVVGILLVTLAYFIIRAPKNEFFEHLGLAVSLAGQALVVYSFIGDSLFSYHSDYGRWFYIGVFHTALAVFMPNFVHRVFSSAFAAIFFDVAFLEIGAPYIVSSIALIIGVVLYTKEFKTTKSYKNISGAVYGLILYWLIVNSIISVNTMFFDLFYRPNREQLFQLPYQVAQGLFVFAILFSVWSIIHYLKKAPTTSATFAPAIPTTRMTIMALSACFIVCLLTLHATGMTATLVIIVLGFSRSNRVMMGMGIIGLLSYCSVYYYTMEQTLLYKSAILFAVGMVMLVVRFAIVRFWPTPNTINVEGV